jgi:hypothetical protein
MEKMSEKTVLGSGLTQSAARQMEILSYNAAKAVERWLLENPEWFGLPPLGTPETPQVTTFGPNLPGVTPATVVAE